MKETNLTNEYLIQFLKVKFWKKFFEFAFFLKFSIIAQNTTLQQFLSRRTLILNKPLKRNVSF